jgi:DNA-binding MarR family transcriptional regulator
VVDPAVSEEQAGRGVPLPKHLLRKNHALLAALGSREHEVLAGGEVPGVRGHEIEKPGFVFCVAETPEIGDAGLRQAHSLKAQNRGHDHYSLRPSEVQCLAEVGKFRVVAVEDLAKHAYAGDRSRMDSDLRNLIQQRLVERRETNALKKESRQVLTLTKQGQRLIRQHGFVPEDQAIHSGFVKPKEADHDSALYLLYHKATDEIEQKGGKALRIQLDYELKEKLYRKLGQAQVQGEGKTQRLKEALARELQLPIVHGKVSFPDLRIEYTTQEMEIARVDLELATGHYHAGHLAEKARAGFQIYARSEDAAGLRRVRDDREHSVEHIRTKLAILDFVLGHLDYRYLETEAEKVDYFCSKLGISRAVLPAKRYTGAIRQKTTDRYFVDKISAVLCFRTFFTFGGQLQFCRSRADESGELRDSSLGLRQLIFGSANAAFCVYIATLPTHFESARKLFLAMTDRWPKTDPSKEILRYFAVRKFWDTKHYEILSTDDIAFLNTAEKRFNDPRTEIRYHAWAENRISSDMVRAEFRDLATKPEFRFNTELVDGQAALFESKAPGRDQRIAEAGVTNALQATFGSGFKSVFEGETRQTEEK